METKSGEQHSQQWHQWRAGNENRKREEVAGLTETGDHSTCERRVFALPTYTRRHKRARPSSHLICPPFPSTPTCKPPSGVASCQRTKTGCEKRERKVWQRSVPVPKQVRSLTRAVWSSWSFDLAVVAPSSLDRRVAPHRQLDERRSYFTHSTAKLTW
jgi:hypothetical protein